MTGHQNLFKPATVTELDGGPEARTFPRTGPLSVDWIAEVPDAVVLLLPPDGDTSAPADRWTEVTARGFRERIRLLARGLIGLGLQSGDVVAIMCRTRYEWTLLSWACAYIGVAVAPIYDTSSALQVQWILTDSEAQLFVVESSDLRATSRVDQLADDIRPEVLIVDEGALQQIEQAASSVHEATLDQRAAAVAESDLHGIVYTSGTTGRPKGCEITHASFFCSADGAYSVIREAVDRGDQPRTVLMLPLAHIFGRVLETATLLARYVLIHEPDMTHVAEAFVTHHPTYIGSVPRVFEKVYAAAAAKAQAKGRRAAKIFAAAERTAVEVASTPEPGAGLRSRYALYDRLVYRKLRAALGGQCRTIISGGSALSPHLSRFFEGVGFEILEGYGLTEVGITNVNPPGGAKIGTVGPPLPGVRMTLGPDGEVLIEAPQAMTGYRGDPEATRMALTTDGWCRTGDLGSFEGGHLRIIGRSKDLIVTAGGQNIAPGVLEDSLTQHPLIGQALVVGNGRPYVSALLTLNEEGAAYWARNNGIYDGEDLSTHPEVMAAIEQQVAASNELVSRAESVRKWRLLPAEWTVESGDLTPTLKMKRNVITERAADVIREMYGERRA
ncbi:AMP-dependent synthetase/ligase [Flexivirga alba]|uniref:Acyl-CoA synthetase n=1 Tax=Flexivirga alba TaxID=702742 RepID=A0ABW2ADA9_9MICO